MKLGLHFLEALKIVISGVKVLEMLWSRFWHFSRFHLERAESFLTGEERMESGLIW